MNFGKALEQVKKGKRMRLPYWNKNIVVGLQRPDPLSKMTIPYLYISVGPFHKMPWAGDAIDIIEEDWQVVE